jgi:EAL domain-containing protein (putative c-di-GMP-specific phosphodiesterase class I)/GGDEF domain-containing protein
MRLHNAAYNKILIPLLFVILPLGMLYLFNGDRDEVDRYLYDKSVHLKQILSNVDSSFTAYEQLITTAGIIVEELPPEVSAHEDALRQVFRSSRSELIYGIGIWYEPETFNPRAERFGPYIHRITATSKETEITYFWNTPEYDYHKRDWYLESLRQEKGGIAISPPYFDSDYTYITFGTPFFRDGAAIGVVTVDIILPLLQEYFSVYDFSDFSGVYLTTSDGSIVFSRTVADENALEKHAMEGAQPGLFEERTAVFDREEIEDFFRMLGEDPFVVDHETRNGVFRIHGFINETAVLLDHVSRHLSHYLIFLFFWGSSFSLALFSASYIRKNLQNRVLNTENDRLKEEINRREEAEARLSFQAYHDDVSGLKNLHAFIAEEADPQRSGDRRSMIQISLDNIRELSMILDREIIDQALKLFTSRLKGMCSPGTRLYRSRGFSFLIVRGKAGASEHAEGLAREFRQALRLGTRNVRLRARIGLVDFSEADDLEQILSMSQSTLMDQGELNAGGVARYDRNVQERKSRQVILDAAMSQPGFTHELRVVYQPIVRIDDRSIVGMEALVRWDSAALGRMVSPGEFIPLAEENGIIIELGWYVLESVLKVLSGPLADSNLFVTVNVSPLQLIELDFPEKLDALLQAYSVDKGRLKLEITESSAALAIASFWQIVEELIRREYRLAIDDFGTGESSFHRLYNMDFDTLKIDRSFIKNLHMDQRTLESCRSLLSLGRTMGSRVVTEGVEIEEEHRALLEIGVEYAQGFLYSRPLPIDKILK